MGFQSYSLCENTKIMKDIFIQISKYSGSDIIVTDENFNIIFYNSKYVEDKEFLTLFGVIDELLNDNLRTKLNNFKESENNHLYLKLFLKSSKELGNMPVEIHFCKIRNSKLTTKGFVIILKDVIQEIRNRIQKETFVDIISHDLKNPMRANIQILELILDNKYGYINKELKIVLNELLHSCKFMKYMADNLILKYKNEFDACELNKKRYSIVKLIKEKCRNLIKLLDRKSQSVELIIHNNIPDVFIDTEEINKVIKNLLINASNEGRENSKITIKINSDSENVFVSLIDNGFNQKEIILDSLFEEYITCSNKFRKIGFSLELFNCRKIIEAHGGSINAQNLSKNGKIITFSLPIFKEMLPLFICVTILLGII